MAGHTVADSNVLKAKEHELYAELRQAKSRVRMIEQELNDLQHGIVHEREDENWIPAFLRKDHGTAA